MLEVNDLAETVVVNDTQSLLKTSCVVPVISSHCAELVPPTRHTKETHETLLQCIPSKKNSPPQLYSHIASWQLQVPQIQDVLDIVRITN